MTTCVRCGQPSARRRCLKCFKEYERQYSAEWRRKKPLAAKAHNAVGIEITARRLLRAKHFACVDCGKKAHCYDHRDYTKPLEIEPVCGGCNKRRGPGHPYIAA